MEVKNKVVVTGGASGIGEAMARRFASECARGWRDLEAAQQVAKDRSGLAVQVVFRRELMSGGHELTVGDFAQAGLNGREKSSF